MHRLLAALLLLASLATAQVTGQTVHRDGRIRLHVDAPAANLAYALLSLSPATVATPFGAVLAEPAVVPLAWQGPGSFAHEFDTALLAFVGGTFHWQAAVFTGSGLSVQPVISFTLPPAPPRVRIVVLAGQSNMEGEAVLPLPAGIRATNQHLPVWDRLTGAPRWAPLQAGANNNGAFRSSIGGVRMVHGPEMAFAEARARQIEAGAGGAPTLLVKAAQSGSSLFPQAPDFTWDPATPGNLYDDLGAAAGSGRGALLHDLRAAIDSVGGPAAVERIDFCWYQGESDALHAVPAQQYEQRLTRFLGRVRADFAGLPVTFHLVQLHRDIVRGTSPTAMNGFWYCDLVRDAQAAVAAREPDVRLLSVDDLPLAADRTHYGADGYRAIGERLFASWRVN